MLGNRHKTRPAYGTTEARDDAPLRNICATMADRRQLHGAYRAWLYRTQAWHISFEEWKADRDATVELLTA